MIHGNHGTDSNINGFLSDEDDSDIPDRLNQSLRSIRGSAKRKRMAKMLSTDLSQSFDARIPEPKPLPQSTTSITAGDVGIGARINKYENEYNHVFGNKSKTMPGNSIVSFSKLYFLRNGCFILSRL